MAFHYFWIHLDWKLRKINNLFVQLLLTRAEFMEKCRREVSTAKGSTIYKCMSATIERSWPVNNSKLVEFCSNFSPSQIGIFFFQFLLISMTIFESMKRISFNSFKRRKNVRATRQNLFCPSFLLILSLLKLI